MNIPKITNKELIQSYIITAARYDFSVHEKRIIYRLVEMCQYQIEGKKLNKDFKMDKTLFGDYIVAMPVSSFLAGEEDEHYTRAKAALRSLRNKTIEVEDDKRWKLIGMIEKPILEKRGVVTFELQPEIFEAILNFSKGFRKIELKTAMSFESVYSMRFYELFSGKEGQKITYSIDNLKIMFQLQKKYKLTADFKRYVIEAAQNEMKLKSPFSFEYSINKIGKKMDSINFFPYAIKENKDENLEVKKLEKQTSLNWDLDRMVVNYLKQNYFFDTDEIKHNRKLFVEASQKLDLMLLMANKRRYCADRKSPKGSLITILKKELAKVNEVE